MVSITFDERPGEPTVTPGDRLSFAIFLALVLHAVLILGVTFTYLDRGPSTHSMEVTLAQHRSTNTPDKADFLAQFDQQGSGRLEEKKLLTSPNQTQFHDTLIKETTTPQLAAQTKSQSQSSHLLTTSETSSQKLFSLQKIEKEALETAESEIDRTILQKSLEIASLEARLDQQRQLYAKRPRVKRLTSLSTTASADAYYLNSWRRKIETIGNLNYPQEARKNKLYGSLRLMVAIMPNGTLKEVELLQSSGHKALDEAAIRIVRLASPFAPFPDELRKTTDVLEIIRTWQFRKNSSLRSF